MTREQLITIADIRLNEVENRMGLDREVYPAFAATREEEAILTGELVNSGVDPLVLDRLISSLTAQGAEVAIEMYVLGYMDCEK